MVVMDNLRVHQTARVRQLIEEKGCQLRFLPAYSPDFSPILRDLLQAQDRAAT
jgi:transposase